METVSAPSRYLLRLRDGFRGGRWEGRDIKPSGSPNCYPVGGTCLPIENWQHKTAAEIERAIRQFEQQNGKVG